MATCSWCGAQFEDSGDDDASERVTCSILCWLEVLNFEITHRGSVQYVNKVPTTGLIRPRRRG
jgi:hypothetical protein